MVFSNGTVRVMVRGIVGVGLGVEDGAIIFVCLRLGASFCGLVIGDFRMPLSSFV